MIEELPQILVLGGVSGAILGLLALGFTLIYGVAQLINLAHGALFMLGSYYFFSILTSLGYNADPYSPIYNPNSFLVIPAIILTTIVIAIIGIVIYRLLIQPVIEDELAALVITVFVAMALQQYVRLPEPLGFGGEHQDVPSGIAGSFDFLGVTVTYAQLVAFIVSVSLFAVIATFVAKTKIGRAMRAIAQDRDTAMLMGVNTRTVYMITMAIASALAAVAGIFVVSAEGGTARPEMWLEPLGMGLAVVILGGFGSIKGTFVACFIVGYASTTVALLIPEGSYLRGAVALAVMVAVILLRPRGLFGKRVELE